MIHFVVRIISEGIDYIDTNLGTNLQLISRKRREVVENIDLLIVAIQIPLNKGLS